MVSLRRDLHKTPALARRLRRRRPPFREWPEGVMTCFNSLTAGEQTTPRLFHLTYSFISSADPIACVERIRQESHSYRNVVLPVSLITSVNTPGTQRKTQRPQISRVAWRRQHPECLHTRSERAAGIGLKLVSSKVHNQLSLAVWHNPF